MKPADILVIGTPIWLGEKTSVCTRVIERLYSSSGEYNSKGRFTFVDKVAGWIAARASAAKSPPAGGYFSGSIVCGLR